MKKVLTRTSIIFLVLAVGVLTTTLFDVGYFSKECINLNDINHYYIDSNDNLVLATENTFEYEKGIAAEYHTYTIEYIGDGNVNITK